MAADITHMDILYGKVPFVFAFSNFLIFVLNIDCEYSLEQAPGEVLTNNPI